MQRVMAAVWWSSIGGTNEKGGDARGERRDSAMVLNICPIGLAFKIDGTSEGGAHKYGGGFRI